MSYRHIKRSLRGVGFTLPTPFSTDGDQVLHDELRSNVDGLLEADADLFIPCGNTGEYYSLSNEERAAVVETTADAVGDEGTVVGGAGGSTKNVLELIERYEAAGADGVMVMNPSHVYSHEQGMIDYYDRILSATDLGVVVYKRGSLITRELIAELAPRENFVGVKFAVNDVDAFAQTVDATPDDEVVFVNGIAERFAPSFAVEGADGFTTGIGNFVPEPVLELHDALEAGDWEEARRLRDLLRPFENLRQEAVGGPAFGSAKNVPVVKHGLETRGWYGGPVREPLRGLSEEDERRVEELYRRLESAQLTGPA